MSYSDDRTPLPPPQGRSNPPRGYSDELADSQPLPPRRPTPDGGGLPPRRPAPAEASVPLKNVDLRRPRVAPSARPSIIDDEELSIYGEDTPDFSNTEIRLRDPAPPQRRPEPAPLPVPQQTPRPTPTPTPAPAAYQSPLPAPVQPAPSRPAPQPAPAPQARPQAQPQAAPPHAAPVPTAREEASSKYARPASTGQPRTFTADASLRPAATGELLLNTHGLVKSYDGRTVVKGVDINVRRGEIVGLLGPNGAGKTTSFYMIVGLVPPNAGQVLFNDKDVTHMPMYLRARLGMGYLPQEESIFRKLTVEENLMAVMETLPIPRKERIARCQELLERFSITHIRKNIALTCSGGEKRRLTIARSLVTQPNLLMLDEPFSGVDPIAVNEIQGIVEDLRKSGLAILITDHNARQTLELVDRAYLIYEGKVLREGTRDFLINDPVSRELYLGDRFTM